MTIQELDRYILAVYHSIGIVGWLVFIAALFEFIRTARGWRGA